jgi:hypothetical protein
MTDDPFEYRSEEAEKVQVGDLIEFRYTMPFSIDDDECTPPTYRWESVEVTAILPRAPAGTVVVKVRHADGRTSIQTLGRIWRWRAN